LSSSSKNGGPIVGHSITLLDQNNEPLQPGWSNQYDISPNFSDWLLGDLVLFRSEDFDKLASHISKAQRQLGFDLESASWTHAAIYSGDGNFIHASIDILVSEVPAYHVISPATSFCTRRFDLIKTNADGQKIVNAARRLIGCKYGLGEVVNIALQALIPGQLIKNSQINRANITCSRLFELSVVDAFSVGINTSTKMPTVPAFLYNCPDLIKISAGWRLI
jgi:hypothetical protein